MSSIPASPIHSIASRILVCTLRTGAWRANKLNKKETAELNKKHGLKEGTAKVPVHVCDHAALAELSTIHGAAYDYHTSVTQPSIDDAIRLLPCTKELEHAAKMSEFRTQHLVATDRFLCDYPSERADAPRRLNGLFDATAWPTDQQIGKKFRFEVSYRPCPTDGAWQDWLNVSVQAAQEELTEKLTEAIRHVATRCGSDGKLYQTVFSNLKELLLLVPDLNLAHDQRLNALAQQATILADQDKDDVVKSPGKRKAIADKANELLNMFGG